MTDFFRFPQTPHLAWLGRGQPRNDKILAPDEVEDLLVGTVVVEEKVDGANIGISVGPEGEVRVQNRGQFLDSAHSHPQFQPLWSWLPSREAALVDALWPDLILFGEWCVAVHSVRYDRLPDWFLGFDVYDREIGFFWDTKRRDTLLRDLGLAGVPHLHRGQFTLQDLTAMLVGTSRVGTGPIEGIVVRKEGDGRTEKRAKLVHAEFAQAIDEHWSRAPMRRNALVVG